MRHAITPPARDEAAHDKRNCGRIIHSRFVSLDAEGVCPVELANGSNSDARTGKGAEKLLVPHVHLGMRCSISKSSVAQNMEVRVLFEDDCFLSVSDLRHPRR
jgi:hypothetical protein